MKKYNTLLNKPLFFNKKQKLENFINTFIKKLITFPFNFYK